MTKVKIICFLVFGSSLWLSCKTNTASKCGPCPEYAELALYLNVRIVDKTTGADLFLSPGSPYKLSDLKVSSSVAGDNVTMSVDSTEKDNRFVKILAAGTTFTIKLADLSADTIRLVLKTDSPKCCPMTKLSSILLDNTPVCSPCSYDFIVTIKK